MTVLEAITARRSIRRFTDQQVPEEMIDVLLDAVRWAPSAGNLQSRKFFFILDVPLRTALAAAALGQQFIARAPLVVVACADLRISLRYGERGADLYCIQDSAASVQNLLLAAHELGLGSCWVGAFDEAAVNDLLSLPEYHRPVAIIPVGYAAKEVRSAPARKKREETAEIIRGSR